MLEDVAYLLLHVATLNPEHNILSKEDMDQLIDQLTEVYKLLSARYEQWRLANPAAADSTAWWYR